MELAFGNWSVLTTNFLVILYLALGGVTLSAVLHLCNGKWRFEVRDIACSMAILFPLAFILMLILLINGDNTFQWLEGAHDEGTHLPGWHNYGFLVGRQIVGFIIIFGLYRLFIRYQRLSEVDKSYKVQRTFRNIALLIPFAYVTYGSMIAWDYEMTMWPNWHSASYAFYHFQSNFHFYLAAFTILLYLLVRSGKLSVQMDEMKVFNFMAQFMLGMTILYTYLYFTQYLIMWYGRFPEEMARYNNMMLYDYAKIWWAFLALKFVIPFCTFALTPNRHNPHVIVLVACSIVVGTWLERYTWISGSLQGEYHIPMTSIFDIVVTAVIAIIAFFMIRWSLARNGLLKSS